MGNEIKKTSDYSIFKFMEDNRKINENHAKCLEYAIKYQNDLHLHPIIVNSDMEVIDGQHRLMAAKNLSVPIFYLVDDNYNKLKMIVFNTTQKRWTIEDYLNFWVVNGSQDYILVREFCEKAKVGLTLALEWIEDCGEHNFKAFKNGAYRFRMTNEATVGIESTKKLISFLRERNFKPQCMFSKKTFHRACKAFFCNPIIDHHRFFERLPLCSHHFYFTHHIKDYIGQLVDIYNYDMRKQRIKIMVDGKKMDFGIQ